jgi:hypothetical protein
MTITSTNRATTSTTDPATTRMSITPTNLATT